MGTKTFQSYLGTKTFQLILRNNPKFLDGIFCETSCIPYGGIIFKQETNALLNLLEFSIFSTDNSIIVKIVLSKAISII